MRAGSLDRRARFQHFQDTSDGAGGSTRAWVDFGTFWAQFSPERARERIKNGRLTSSRAGVVRIRRFVKASQIDETFRVILEEGVMNIRSKTTLDDMIEFAVETDGTAS